MGFLQKRKPDNTPVRRVGEVIDIPSAAPPGVPTPQPGQNPTGNTYVFVNAPQPQQPQQPQPQQQPFAPPPHQTIHHHTTIIQQPRLARRWHQPGSSSLTATAMSLALLACLICWIPDWGRFALPIGALGIAVGALAFLNAILFRRSKASTPFRAMLICALAMVVWVGHDFFAGAMSALLGKSTSSTPAKPSPAPSEQNSRPSVPAPPAPSLSTPPTPSTVSPSSPPATVTSAKADLTRAQSQLDADLASDSTYQSAKSAADAAQANVQTVRSSASAGSPELAQASQQWIDAKDALTEAMKTAQAANPTIAADVQAVQKAQAALDAIQNPRPPAND